MPIIDDETRRFGRLLHYAGVLATVLCATAGYSLVHSPMIESIAGSSARIEDLKLSLQNSPVMREQHREESKKYNEVITQIAEMQRRVPSDAEAAQFLKEVARIAGDEQLAIKDFAPGKPESRSGYAEMQVTLNGSGSFDSICTFLDRLAKLKRLSKVKDLTLSAGEDASQYPMTATLVIYFGLKGKEAPKPAQEDRRG